MGIKVTISKTFELSDIWCNKKEFNECFKNNRQAFIEFIMEDWATFLEEAEHIDGIIETYEWIDPCK